MKTAVPPCAPKTSLAARSEDRGLFSQAKFISAEVNFRGLCTYKEGKETLKGGDASTLLTWTLEKTNLAVEFFHFRYGTEYSNNEVGLRQRQPVNVY